MTHTALSPNVSALRPWAAEGGGHPGGGDQAAAGDGGGPGQGGARPAGR